MVKRLTVSIGAIALGLVLLAISLGLVAGGGNPEVVEAGLWAQGHIFHTDAVTNANGTAMDVRGFPLVGVQVEGVTEATITFEATTDGTNYDAIQAVNTSDGAAATTTTADGQFWVAVGGKENLRCRISGYSIGTIDVVGLGVTHPGPVNMADSALGSPADGTYIGDINFGESLPAGTNTIGDVTISEFNETSDITVTLDGETVAVSDVTTGTVDIGEITSALPAGANTIGDVTVSSVTTGTIQVDDGGNVLSVDDGGSTLSVDDGASTLSVDGTVAVSSVTTGTIQVDDGGNILSVDDGGGSLTVDDGATSLTVDGAVTADTELVAAALADTTTNPTVPTVGTADLLFNDATWDRERNNYIEWPFPMLQRTHSPGEGSFATLTNYNARGAYIFVEITDLGVDQTLTVRASIYDYDGAGTEASDQAADIMITTALTPTGSYAILIYPGAGAAAEEVVETLAYPLPRLWRVGYTVSNGQPITFSIGVHYIN